MPPRWRVKMLFDVWIFFENLSRQSFIKTLTIIMDTLHEDRGTAVAQWLRCCATNRKVAGSIPTSVSVAFPSYCAEDNFWSKWRFVWQSVSLKDSHINVVDCTFHFLSHDQLHVVFSWPSAFDCVSVTVIEGHGHLTQNDKLITSDTVYRKVL